MNRPSSATSRLFLATALLVAPACGSRSPIVDSGAGEDQPGDTIIEVNVDTQDRCSETLGTCDDRTVARIDPCNRQREHLAIAGCLGNQSECVAGVAETLATCVEVRDECYADRSGAQNACNSECNDTTANTRYVCDEDARIASSGCDDAYNRAYRDCEDESAGVLEECMDPVDTAFDDCNGGVQTEEINCREDVNNDSVDCRNACVGSPDPYCYNDCEAEAQRGHNACFSTAGGGFNGCADAFAAGQDVCSDEAQDTRDACIGSSTDPGCWNRASLARELCRLGTEETGNRCNNDCYSPSDPDECATEACYEESLASQNACEADYQECLADGIVDGIVFCDNQAERDFSDCDAEFDGCRANADADADAGTETNAADTPPQKSP